MNASSESSVLQSLLEDAVEKSKSQVGKSLIEDQLAIQLRTCDSVESVAALLEEQAQAFRKFLGHDCHGKMTKSIKHVMCSAFQELDDVPPVTAIIGVVAVAIDGQVEDMGKGLKSRRVAPFRPVLKPRDNGKRQKNYSHRPFWHNSSKLKVCKSTSKWDG
ncbi:hypothetical protein BJV78DRAFT_1303813 [Lactifluus subvellereus]|nr:hypothetical protein BJV78DRAFT_1303813 [Lactifluus subvellereus]